MPSEKDPRLPGGTTGSTREQLAGPEGGEAGVEADWLLALALRLSIVLCC
jgi:hypothetical protein